MSKFYFQEKQSSKLLLILWPILAIAKGVTWYQTREQLDLIIALFFTIAFIFGFLGMRKKQIAYLIIDKTGIEWFYEKMVQPIKVNRDEVKWIKFENEGVSIYQASSFREFVSLKNLKPEEQESVKLLLDDYPKGA